jgi:hypothetical protein
MSLLISKLPRLLLGIHFLLTLVVPTTLTTHSPAIPYWLSLKPRKLRHSRLNTQERK